MSGKQTTESFESLNLYRKLTEKKVERHTVSTRVSTDTLEILDRLASHFDQSRSGVAAALIEGGCRDAASAIGIELNEDGTLKKVIFILVRFIMFSITGQVINVFHTPGTEKYDESYKVQLLGDNYLKTGQIRKEMITLSVPRDVHSAMKEAIGEFVTFNVGIFVQHNKLIPFYQSESSLPPDSLPAAAGGGGGKDANT